MAENVLNGGLEVCKQIRDRLRDFTEARKGAEEAKNAAANGDKTVKAKEKAVKDEIAATIKKRKEEIEQSYDKEIDLLKERTRAVKDEKGKERGEQQAKRIENETAGNREKERELLLEIRDIYKRDGIPSIFNTNLFYALFMPRTFIELLILAGAALLALLAIPMFIVFVLMKSPSTMQAMLVYGACVLVFVGLYMLIAYFTKDKFRTSFREILKIRKEIRANRRDMKSVSNRVQRDKDDSKYDLSHFDAEMERISAEIDRVSEKKKEALKGFENETKQAISDQIEEKNKVEIEELKAFVDARIKEEKELAERAKELGLFIAGNYEPFVGKQDLQLELFNKAVEIMEAEKAATVAEALEKAKDPDFSLAPEPVPEEAAEPAEGAEAEVAGEVTEASAEPAPEGAEAATEAGTEASAAPEGSVETF